MESNVNTNTKIKNKIINQEKSPKKKISPFLYKLYNILEVNIYKYNNY